MMRGADRHRGRPASVHAPLPRDRSAEIQRTRPPPAVGARNWPDSLITRGEAGVDAVVRKTLSNCGHYSAGQRGLANVQLGCMALTRRCPVV